MNLLSSVEGEYEYWLQINSAIFYTLVAFILIASVEMFLLSEDGSLDVEQPESWTILNFSMTMTFILASFCSTATVVACRNSGHHFNRPGNFLIWIAMCLAVVARVMRAADSPITLTSLLPTLRRAYLRFFLPYNILGLMFFSICAFFNLSSFGEAIISTYASFYIAFTSLLNIFIVVRAVHIWASFYALLRLIILIWIGFNGTIIAAVLLTKPTSESITSHIVMLLSYMIYPIIVIAVAMLYTMIQERRVINMGS